METRPDLDRIEPGRAWLFGVPACALAAHLVVVLFDANQSLFFLVNAWGPLTSDLAWACITTIGDGRLASILLLPFLGRRPRIVWAGLLAGMASLMLCHLLKQGFDSHRPGELIDAGRIHIIGPCLRKSAFPSGHTMTIFALGGTVALGLRSRGWRWVIVVLATLVGISRVVVGAHWPGDVLGGAALGWLCAVSGRFLAGRWPRGTESRFQLVIGVLAAFSAIQFMFHEHEPEGVAPLVWLLVSVGLIGGATGWLARWHEIRALHRAESRDRQELRRSP